ncbi:hypothetical protein DFP72DRAFT_1052614 [Ephemerocybe angulata]|uniref:Uncharacterized protein n=1 Tax=Ephemerocybe angulata TaxID=980116 RepID=A0A8H6HCP9_9AGAR|nr:hypothetical protein DFP72DRAFT_1052614 [Tulosesus angulatus]
MPPMCKSGERELDACHHPRLSPQPRRQTSLTGPGFPSFQPSAPFTNLNCPHACAPNSTSRTSASASPTAITSVSFPSTSHRPRALGPFDNAEDTVSLNREKPTPLVIDTFPLESLGKVILDRLTLATSSRFSASSSTRSGRPEQSYPALALSFSPAVQTPFNPKLISPPPPLNLQLCHAFALSRSTHFEWTFRWCPRAFSIHYLTIAVDNAQKPALTVHRQSTPHEMRETTCGIQGNDSDGSAKEDTRTRAIAVVRHLEREKHTLARPTVPQVLGMALRRAGILAVVRFSEHLEVSKKLEGGWDREAVYRATTRRAPRMRLLLLELNICERLVGLMVAEW